jgi:hypothetical protein
MTRDEFIEQMVTEISRMLDGWIANPDSLRFVALNIAVWHLAHGGDTRADGCPWTSDATGSNEGGRLKGGTGGKLHGVSFREGEDRSGNRDRQSGTDESAPVRFSEGYHAMGIAPWSLCHFR